MLCLQNGIVYSDLTVNLGILRCHFLVNQSSSCSGKCRVLLAEQLFLHLGT